MKKQNMKTWICKATLAATLTCLALGGATVAQAAGCSNATLTGKYGQTISGELLPAAGTVLPQNGVAMTTFDGKGKFTQVDFVVINGTPTSTNFASERGTYMVNSNCTGERKNQLPERVLDRSGTRGCKSGTRVSYGCIPADHGRKPGASEHRQQWHSRGQRWSH
jgi:hypothetical protein